MPILPITSVDDPRIAAYRDVKDRDLHRRDNLFIVEGKVTVSRLIEQSRFPVRSLLLADGRTQPMRASLDKLDAIIPVYTAPQDIMDAIAGFPLHRGVLALAERTPPTSVEQLIDQLPNEDAATLLVLIGLSNHDNVGACFRNAAALGADAIILDGECCDPLYRKAVRVSAGTALSLPFAQADDRDEMIAQLQTAGFTCWSLTPDGGDNLHETHPPKRLAIILGPEGPGLPEQIMEQTTRITIPIKPGIDSLNVATAGAIALSHVFAGRIET